MTDGLILMGLGTIIGGVSVGIMYTTPIGFLTIAGGLVLMGIISIYNE